MNEIATDENKDIPADEGTNNNNSVDDSMIFNPIALVVLILQRGGSVESSDWKRSITIRHLNSTSAKLTLTVSDELKLSDEYILDIQARIIARETRDLETKEVLSCLFRYDRLGIQEEWQVFPSAVGGFDEMKYLDFIFGQYVYYDNHQRLDKTMKHLENNIPKLNRQKESNIIAKGIEGTGNLVRYALKGSGKLTGFGIRKLGNFYTSASVKSRKFFGKPVAALNKDDSNEAENEFNNSENSGDNLNLEGRNDEFFDSITPDVNPELIDDETPNQKDSSKYRKLVSEKSATRAIEVKKSAETVHASARTLTGAALYPVRWTGKKAAEWASTGNNNIDMNAPDTLSEKVSNNTVTRVVNDTVGGVFNAVVNSFKGLTEALDEIGSAIGDTALNHAEIIHGKEYKEKVTKQYVEAAGEIGLAGYKILNVASIGLVGIAADAAVEGATFLSSLSDFLVGPIILQGYMDAVQLPLVTPKRYFVVLRPWSIAFYSNASEIFKCPKKIVITAMLDTLPRLRNYPSSIEERVSGDMNNSRDSNEENQKLSWTERLRGGKRPHIEICTVDCSTYLIYPEDDSDNEINITDWFEELKIASKRVESIAKHKSGAEDIALERRLRSLPISRYLVVSIVCCVLDVQSTGVFVSAMPDERNEDLEVDVDMNNPIDSDDNPSELMSSTLEADHCPIVAAEPMDESKERLTDDFPSQGTATAQASVKSVHPEFVTVPSMVGVSINKFHRSTITSLRVRMIPLSDRGIYLTDELQFTEPSDVKSYHKVVNRKIGGSTVEPSATEPTEENESKITRYLSTLYDKEGLDRLENDGNKVCQWRDQQYKFGENHCIVSGDIKYITLTLQGKTILGGYMELGRGRISMIDLMLATNYNDPYPKETSMWIPLVHDSSKQRIGFVYVSANFKDIRFDNNNMSSR